MAAIAIRDFRCLVGCEVGIAGINRNKHAAFVDPAFVICRVILANSVIGEQTGKPASRSSDGSARKGRPWNSDTCDGSCGHQWPDTWDGECRNTQKRAHAGTQCGFANNIAGRIFTRAIGFDVLALMLGNDRNCAVIETS